MQAIVYDRFGGPEVLRLEARPEPRIGDDEMLVAVHATSVTTADWRFRAAAFPAGMRLLGRMIVGFRRPRNRLTGREFSGRVVKVGARVTRFAPGDEIFGVNPRGVNAETIAVPENAVVVRKPEGLSHAEAASLPFGALTALSFLRDLAPIRAGERVLVLGASGGVGAYVVQVAAHLGAEVTASCSTANLALVRSLGAHHVVDYTQEDWTTSGATYDVILDVIGKSTFARARSRLAPAGRHVFIEGGVREIWQSFVTRFRRGPRVVFGIATESVAALERLRTWVETGALRPVVGHRFPMTEVVAAHRVVDERRRRGAVILDWPPAVPRPS